MDDSLRSKRKNEHIQLALDTYSPVSTDFDKVQLIHQSIPSINKNQIDLSVKFPHFTFKYPIYINAMTGGSERAATINKELAQIAKACNIPMAVGSTHSALKDPNAESSFTVVRDENPEGLIFSNVGADIEYAKAKKSIELLNADALQIHVNAPQELIMPEGDTEFENWLTNIQEIQDNIDIPVIIKEVGFGMSAETIQKVKDIGIQYVDVSGRGGTNFADIENQRRPLKDMAFLNQWGQSTVQSLLEAQLLNADIYILASGGVKNPLDAIKSLVLGAEAVGLSGYVLKYLDAYGVEDTIEHMKQFIEQMHVIANLLNASNVSDLKSVSYVLSPELQTYVEQRAKSIKA
ncbi:MULTISPECIES: type 2 isopentenyl-diphosphate Delta-isomerase [Mammaliicoccus]|uniref:type 2 isopentenyl-diphosphate Delta-isomerase n=1 Tax=Mammaliicoccus TaxID=2803850 RepID=UPI000D1E6511|nr:MULTISPECIES: type 2 isopentenyl-diphosphate Delta-isomerase [Mammaliicoccus]PTK23827.1 type 2 isopentenyl-diphosphate Delta-isomerase [Mammaliicoccus sciuri]RIN88092.1 type 2 isopentenyl-diphosphate Delta-isomerase [Mammaliicoccus sciuri]RIO05223.1 type 2 isopentenyl-diphosphate Delta-isomerase [Mammaliicoccus sciuri]RIO15128.1 type 2 isopentenyl-diphosphate Delta-isomerase [Mammaliicoccus sciuri]RIO21091.1 type 2 isopentenyl-diphosphate Delta-isomerase [Mammaliicoccus sciuri]